MGETPKAACIREVKEEANIHISQPVLRGVFTLLDEYHQQEWIMFAFLATKFSGTPLKKSKDGKFKWIPVSEISSLDTVPDVKLYINTLLFQDESIIFGHFNYDKKGELYNYTLFQ